MTTLEWLLILAVVIGAAWAAVGAHDAYAARRTPPPVMQRVRATPPPMRSRTCGDLAHSRPGPAGNGRHRRPQETQA